MPQPVSFARSYDLTSYATLNPSAQYNAAYHDTEFNNIATTFNGVLANLATIQRDDGYLRNASVHADAFSTAALALIASTWTPKGLWATGIAYVVGDVVEESSTSYVCSAAHTAGTFAPDHTAGKWIVLGVASLASVIVTDANLSITGSADATKIAKFEVDGITTGTTRTYTLPNFSGTLATLAGTETLTNKTLTSPTINTPTLTAPVLGTPASGNLAACVGGIGANIASATSTDIGAATGEYVHVTGTTTITGFVTATAGLWRVVEFDGALTLTHNATSLILPGAENITTASGDVGIFVSLGAGNWKCIGYTIAKNGYEEYTAASAACTGAVTAAVVWKLTKAGNVVTLTLPSTLSNGVAVGSFMYGTAIPAKYRPTAITAFLSASIRDNGADLATPGLIYINSSTGAISIYKDGTGAGNFTVTAQAGLTYATSVSWTI